MSDNGVKHSTDLAGEADDGVSPVSKNAWVDSHKGPGFAYGLYPQFVGLTNQPAGEREFGGASRQWYYFDLTDCTDIRFSQRVRVAGASGSYVAFMYTADLTGATGWVYIDGTTGPRLALEPVGMRPGAWLALPAGAKAEVLVKIMDGGGDGTADPEVSALFMHVR